MARPIEFGIPAWLHKVGMYDDHKFLLAQEYVGERGGTSIEQLIVPLVADKILDMLYKNSYYLPWSSNMSFVIAKAIGYGISSTSITRIVTALVDSEFFHAGMLRQHNILTGRGIQRTWLQAINGLKRKAKIKPEHLLLDGTEDDNDGVPQTGPLFTPTGFSSGINNGQAAFLPEETTGKKDETGHENRIKNGPIAQLNEQGVHQNPNYNNLNSFHGSFLPEETTGERLKTSEFLSGYAHFLDESTGINKENGEVNSNHTTFVPVETTGETPISTQREGKGGNNYSTTTDYNAGARKNSGAEGEKSPPGCAAPPSYSDLMNVGQWKAHYMSFPGYEVKRQQVSISLNLLQDVPSDMDRNKKAELLVRRLQDWLDYYESWWLIGGDNGNQFRTLDEFNKHFYIWAKRWRPKAISPRDIAELNPHNDDAQHSGSTGQPAQSYAQGAGRSGAASSGKQGAFSGSKAPDYTGKGASVSDLQRLIRSRVADSDESEQQPGVQVP